MSWNKKKQKTTFEPTTWVVTLNDGTKDMVEAHYAFNNGEEGLMFRRRLDDDEDQPAVIVASYAAGAWASFKRA